MKSNEFRKKYNISTPTLFRWRKSGKIQYTTLPSGHYDYHEINTNEFFKLNEVRKNIIYSRVSTTGQKDNLTRQIERLKSYASSRGIIIDDVYQEIASALNYNRKYYRKMIEDIINDKIDTIIIEYKDRVLRIGFDDFKNLCEIKKVNIIIVDNSDDKDIDKNKEMTNDLISIIHHFSSKMYSLRKNKNKITKLLEDN